MYNSADIMPPPNVSCPDYLTRERTPTSWKEGTTLLDHTSPLVEPLDVELDKYVSNNLIGSLIAIGTIQHSEDLAERDIPFYMCNYCDFKTVQRVDMLKHLDLHRFGCKFCEYEIFSRAEVIRHTVKCHKEELKSDLLRYCVLSGDKEFKRELSEDLDSRSKQGLPHSGGKGEYKKNMDDSMFDDNDDDEDMDAITQNETFRHVDNPSGYIGNINKSYESNQKSYQECSREEGSVTSNSNRQSMINYSQSYENHNQNSVDESLVFNIQGRQLTTSDFSSPQYFHTPSSQKSFSHGLPLNYEQDMQINNKKNQSYANILEYVPKIVGSENSVTKVQPACEVDDQSSSVSSVDSSHTHSFKEELSRKGGCPTTKESSRLKSRVHKGMKPKTKRKDLSIGERYEVVQLLGQKMSQSAISKRLSCSQSQVSRISNNKEKIISLYEQKTNQDRRRLRTGKAVDIETALTNWVVEARAQKLLVTGPILLEKAKDLARQLNHEGFRPSNGWLSRWKEKNNLSFSVRASRKPQKHLFNDGL